MKKITHVRWISGGGHGLTRTTDGQKFFNFAMETGTMDSWEPVEIDYSDEARDEEQRQILEKFSKGGD